MSSASAQRSAGREAALGVSRLRRGSIGPAPPPLCPENPQKLLFPPAPRRAALCRGLGSTKRAGTLRGCSNGTSSGFPPASFLSLPPPTSLYLQGWKDPLAEVTQPYAPYTHTQTHTHKPSEGTGKRKGIPTQERSGILAAQQLLLLQR